MIRVTGTRLRQGFGAVSRMNMFWLTNKKRETIKVAATNSVAAGLVPAFVIARFIPSEAKGTPKQSLVLFCVIIRLACPVRGEAL